MSVHRPEPTYRVLASTLQAVLNCKESDNLDWGAAHTATIDKIMRDTGPSGAGINSGTKFNWESSRPDRLVFDTAFHHMNDAGGYDGWTEHQVIVTASLCSPFELKITGRNRNDIKEYLLDVFYTWLCENVPESCYCAPDPVTA